MAGIKISELPEASCILGDELVAIVQDSCTKFVSASAIGSTGADNITGITTGCGLVGGGTCGSINIAMDNNCFDAFDGAHTTLAAASANWEGTYSTVSTASGTWDQSACPGLNCIGAITEICTGSGMAGGGTSGSLCFVMSPACTTRWNGTATTVQANSASWAGGTGDITGVTAGTLLSGGATSGDATLGIDSGALNYLNQSACAGLNCVGDVTTSTNQTICGNKCFNGNILSAGVNLDQLFGSGGGGSGDITGVTAGAGLSGGATTGNATLALDGCVVSALNQSGCAGINCTGTTTADNTQNFTNKSGNISQWTNDSNYAQVCGTDNKLTRFNAAGNNIEDSCITDTSTLVTISIDTQVTGDLITGGSGHSVSTSSNDTAIIGGASNTIGGTACCGVVIGGGSNETTAQGSVTIGGTMNCTTAKWGSTIAGALNKVCGSGEQAVVLGGCTNVAKHNSAAIAGATNMTSVSGCMLHANSLFLNNLPVSDPLLAGVVWNCGGTLKISAG
jgi:hypothetical protein